MNAGAAATNAARLRAAAEAATGRIGHSTAASSTDRRDSQVTRSSADAPFVRGVADPGVHRENRVRTVTAFEQVGPSPFFIAQLIAQESARFSDARPDPARVTAAYPSLVAELDIFLPGEQVAFLPDSPRLDRYI